MKLLRTAALIVALVLVALLAIVGLLLLTRQPPGGPSRGRSGAWAHSDQGTLLRPLRTGVQIGPRVLLA